ncbi:MAG TPA: DUF5990 family protein [Caulobacteraceae bacterium]|jgi:hypothetical protein|nr:DUF5990 family protein [Caulobacteraceae bacterium]
MADELHLRLIRGDDIPATNPEGDAFVFGLQDTKGGLAPGVQRADSALVWDFAVQVKPGKDPARPNFLGPYASGPADDRFVYLAWRSIPRGVWINRVKARLSDIDWPLVRAAQAADRPLEADMTGWSPHDRRRQVEWRLAAD